MKMINQFMHDTTDHHRDMVDSVAYAMSAKYAKLKDDYFFIYVKKKPRYIPLWLYRWILQKVIVLANFKQL
jgi:coproporphyrinogen III oxidase